jgi:peptidoglycan-associated lipoprotein
MLSYFHSRKGLLQSVFVGGVLISLISCARKDIRADETLNPRNANSSVGSLNNGSAKSSPGFETVYFDYDQFNLRSDARQGLRSNAEYLKAHPKVKIQIEGHCDERGSTQYNLALGEKRATAAKDYLMKAGVQDSRISVISYGSERPVDNGHDEGAWAKNRRSLFIVTEGEQQLSKN